MRFTTSYFNGMKRQNRLTFIPRHFSSQAFILGWTAVVVMLIAGHSCKKDLSCDGCRDGNSQAGSNRPPIANAGPDQRVADSVMLDGGASSDPDNNIKGFLWRQLSGPSSSRVSNPDVVRTPVTGFDKGAYLFELKVTDAEGLSSTDTVQVIVEKGGQGEEVVVACDNSKRPLVNAQLLPVTSLPAGTGSDFVVVGNRVYFMTMECPGCTGATKKRAYYNIYDLNTQSWSRSREHLVTPRQYGATIMAAGSRIFYAGGSQSDGVSYFAVLRDVDIYDLETDAWTSAALSAGGADIAGAVVNNKVFFAGGLREDPVRLAKPSAIVDIYDLSANRWSVANLGLGRADIEAVTVGSKVYFAGGSAGPSAINGVLGATEHMDIYDDATGTWTVSALTQERTSMTAITVGNRIYWAGGLGLWEGWKGDIEISDLNTNGTSWACLHHEKFWYYGKQAAALAGDNRIVFFTGIAVSDPGYNTRFDIYHLDTNTWTVGQLPVDIADASIFSYNNVVYVVGGKVNGAPSGQVWRLVF